MSNPQLVYIVDDDPTLLSICNEMLESFYQTKTFLSATDALADLGQNSQPDVIITDIVMPKIDGLEFVKILKSRGISSSVVIISGASEKHHAIEALRLGAFGLLEKPFEPLEFEHTVHRAATMYLLKNLQSTLLDEYVEMANSMTYLLHLHSEQRSRIEDTLQELVPEEEKRNKALASFMQAEDVKQFQQAIDNAQDRIEDATQQQKRLRKLLTVLDGLATPPEPTKRTKAS